MNKKAVGRWQLKKKGDERESRRNFAFGLNDKTDTQMYKAHHLYELKGRLIWLADRLLASK